MDVYMRTPIHSKAVERFENLVGENFNNCFLRYFEEEGFDSIISYSSQNLSGGITPCPQVLAALHIS